MRTVALPSISAGPLGTGAPDRPIRVAERVRVPLEKGPGPELDSGVRDREVHAEVADGVLADQRFPTGLRDEDRVFLVQRHQAVDVPGVEPLHPGLVALCWADDCHLCTSIVLVRRTGTTGSRALRARERTTSLLTVHHAAWHRSCAAALCATRTAQ